MTNLEDSILDLELRLSRFKTLRQKGIKEYFEAIRMQRKLYPDMFDDVPPEQQVEADVEYRRSVSDA